MQLVPAIALEDAFAVTGQPDSPMIRSARTSLSNCTRLPRYLDWANG
ncbi:MAG TPA: hypothetical protein VFK04_12760 [Gemmatimonadaceae bacterium]|nr:hypothetical protein [Gemmatimonadaceae bacterium]